MKTNKSYTKRLRVTRKGKIIGRQPGQNHFNAKKSGRARQDDRGTNDLTDRISKKNIQRFLPNHPSSR
jgi:ribosomal protein L35